MNTIFLYYTKNKGYGQAFSKMYTDFKSNFLDEKTTEELKDRAQGVHQNSVDWIIKSDYNVE